MAVMLALPDQFAIFVHCPDPVKWDAVGAARLVQVMKKIMIPGDETDCLKRQPYQLYLLVIDKRKFKPAVPENRIPAYAIEQILDSLHDTVIYPNKYKQF